jgi:dethiobiotin synthetase
VTQVASAQLPGLFVVGTDTGVGKTRVASAIVRGMVRNGRRAGAIKPVATGGICSNGFWCWEDAEELARAVGVDVPRSAVVPLCYEEPLAPSVAARGTGQPLSPAAVERAWEEALAWWLDWGAEVVVVEGVGGLLCPLAEGWTIADLAVALDFPLVIVARRGLGTLNHTLLTVEAVLLRGLRIAGVVLNGAEPMSNPVAEQTNAAELARRLPSGIAILAELPHDAPPALWDWFGGLDWPNRVQPPRGERRPCPPS